MLDERVVSRSRSALGLQMPLDNLEAEHLDAMKAFRSADIAHWSAKA